MTTSPNPKDDGGYAFPWGEHGTRLGGMSLRDYFAAKAMQGLIITRHPHHQGSDGPEQLAADAYLVADAMLKARQENPNG